MTIPRIMHQIWIGDEPPADVLRWRATVLAQHPTWEHHFHRDTSVFTHPELDPELSAALREAEIRVKTYQTKHHPLALVADLLRMTLLWLYGGVYLDLDMECVKPLDDLLDRDLLLVSSSLCNPDIFLMGAPPRSPTIMTILRRIMAARSVPGPAGKMLMMNCLPSLREELDLHALPAEWACPFDRQGRGSVTENTHAIHHWYRDGAGRDEGTGTWVG